MDTSEPISQVLERNIETLVQRNRRDAERRKFPDRVAQNVTRFASSLFFVGIHALIVAFWVVVNLGWTALKPFDPTFVLLATIASVEAIFLTSFVLITQQRMQQEADRRADLDLQISLLTEHELTRLIQMTSALTARLNVETPADPELHEIERDVMPEQVLDALERSQQGEFVRNQRQ
ncbi:MAG: DUF1003 domain-containing protein [Povalibacter sp.]